MVRRVGMLLALVLLASGCFKAFDFDGNNKADPVVVNGNGGWIDVSKAPADSVVYGGAGTDLPVPGDYDGNGRIEVAVVHPNDDWVTLGTAGTFNFPRPAQLPAYTPSSFRYQITPVPADYDGDGKTDAAWYRDTDGSWFIRGQVAVQFGNGPKATTSGIGIPGNDVIDQDFAVPADYDGDGKADLATYNPRTLVWKVRSSRDGSVSSVTMPGSNGTLRFPAPADYDGVKHAQRALFGTDGWTIEGHAAPILFGNIPPGSSIGTGQHYPAVADYDGDGKADLSYVDTYGVWHTRGSADPNAPIPNDTIGPLASGQSPYALEFGVAELGSVARFTLISKNCSPGYSTYPADC